MRRAKLQAGQAAFILANPQAFRDQAKRSDRVMRPDQNNSVRTVALCLDAFEVTRMGGFQSWGPGMRRRLELYGTQRVSHRETDRAVERLAAELQNLDRILFDVVS